MSRKIPTILVFLILLYSFNLHEAHAQQPPWIPPLQLYGTAYLYEPPDGTPFPLTAADTDYTISMRLEQLIIIFLDGLDDQGLIASITGELEATHTVVFLQQAFINSEYCNDHGISLSLSANVTTQISGSEWLVVDGGNTYTVMSEAILVWDGFDWIAGYKLEVYLHDGLIASYEMGSSPPAENYYVLEIPRSPDSVFGGLPPDDTYLLRDPGKAIAGENANLYINNVLITTPELPYEIVQEDYVEMDIYAPSTQQYTINLVAGRNLISLPLQPEDTSRDVVLAPILSKLNSVWWLDPDIGWRWYYPSGSPPSNFGNVMQAGIGYWIDMNDDAALTIQGSAPPTAIQLNPGRNLVGYNLLESKDIEDAMASIHPNYVSVWVFESGFGWRWYFPTNPGGSNLGSLGPEMGVWIDAIGSPVWDVGQ